MGTKRSCRRGRRWWSQAVWCMAAARWSLASYGIPLRRCGWICWAAASY